jgi:acrylyl-CoA reductase (NADPH)
MTAIPAAFRAYVAEKVGDAVERGVREVAETDLPPGEVEIRVLWSSVNFKDGLATRADGKVARISPLIPGIDLAGEVVASEDPGIAVGQAVLAHGYELGVSRHGGYAEYERVPAGWVVPLAAGLSPRDAMSIGTAGFTAAMSVVALEERGLTPSDGPVLVTGASGGVGVASVQLARAMGHTVIALSRNPQKAERLEQLGAHRVFNPNDSEWTRALTEALRGRRVDLVVDNIGGPLFTTVLETLGEHGRVSCVGRLAGPVPQFNTGSLFFRRLKIGGVAVGAYTPAEAREAWTMVLKLLEATGARPLVDSVWEFGKLREAFERLAQGPMGKVVLRVS